MRGDVLGPGRLRCAAGFPSRAAAQDVRRPETRSETFTVAEPLGDCIKIAGDTFTGGGYEAVVPRVISPPPSRQPRHVSTGRTARAVVQVVCVPIGPDRTSVTVKRILEPPQGGRDRVPQVQSAL